MAEDPGTFDFWVNDEDPIPVLQPNDSSLDTGKFDVWVSADRPFNAIVKAAAAAAGDLSVSSTTHNHTTEGVNLTQAQTLSISDATHNHSVDNPSLTGTGSSVDLSISDAANSHKAETPAVTQVQELSISATTHNHTTDSPSLVVGGGELPDSAADGASQVGGSLLAVRFLEAEVSPTSSTQAETNVSVGDLYAEVSGSSSVTASPTAAPELGGSAEPVTDVTGAMERYRAFVVALNSAAVVAGDVDLQLGIRSAIAGGSTVTALLGADIPLAAAISMVATPEADAETGGRSAQDIYMQITGTPVFNNDADPVAGKPGTWTLPVTLRRGGTAGTRIPKGTAVVKWGQYSATSSADFTGGIILTSDLNHAPYIDVFTVFKNNAGVLPWVDAALKPRVRMGNLRGVLGNSIDKWGIAMSTDLSNTSAPYIEASNAGLIVKDANLSIINGQFYVGNMAQTTYLKWDGSSLSIAAEGSGITNINGGNIQTGTITADKLTIIDGGEIRLGNLGRTATDLSTFTGLRMFKSGSTYELSGWSAGIKQAYFGSDGKLYAGGMKARLDGDGLSVVGANGLTWYDDTGFTQLRGKITTQPWNPGVTGFDFRADDNTLVARFLHPMATGNTSYIANTLSVGKDLNVGGNIYAPNGAGLSGIQTGFNFVMDGANAAVITGARGFIYIPVSMQITRIKTLLNNHYTVTCYIYKGSYSTYGTWTMLYNNIGTSAFWKNDQPVNITLYEGETVYIQLAANNGASNITLSFEGYRL